MADSQATIYAPRLKDLYGKTYVPELMKELKLTNPHQVPRLQKIVISSGLGKNKDDKRFYEIVTNTLTKISGQKPVDRMAKKSIASFKIRAGMNRIGVSVQLRDSRMYEFLDRLANVALPRVRDFHGISFKAFDKSGNYSLGITDQSVFPELNFEDTAITHGLQVTFVIKTSDPAHSRALLEKFGLPFQKSLQKGDK
jgi:large subunit ribosomal protein L5